MSASEVEASRDDLEAALIEGFELIDKMVIYTTVKKPQGLAIWSDMDDEEIGILANWRLKRAMLDEKAAIAVRTMIAIHEQFRIAEILAPRFYKTWMAYMDWGFEMPGTQLRNRMKQRRTANR